MTTVPISSPNPEALLAPLLASLPSASLSPTPPEALLPLLSPILRQRVKILSSTSSPNEPWLPLLTYDSSDASFLASLAADDRLEPHPVSGEVEFDWSSTQIRYDRADAETLNARVQLPELDLCTKLIWCVGDTEGGGDGNGWRIGEVSKADHETQWGKQSIAAAEVAFRESNSDPNGGDTGAAGERQEDEDAAYWAQYDSVSTESLAQNGAQAPQTNGVAHTNGAGDEDAYYAQYATVQPALDNEDPDEAAVNGNIERSSGGGGGGSTRGARPQGTTHTHEPPYNSSSFEEPRYVQDEEIQSPRPASAGSSSGHETISRLEETVAVRNAHEIGVKQHLSTNMKSLYRLARSVGISRVEFRRLVTTELDVLSMMDEDDE